MLEYRMLNCVAESGKTCREYTDTSEHELYSSKLERAQPIQANKG
jgi:hypothetical protein